MTDLQGKGPVHLKEAYEHNDQAIVRCVNTHLLLDILTERNTHPMHAAI